MIPTSEAEHDHPAHLRHHFESVEQQKEAASFGMWIFLLTEVMFFGGMFVAYLVYRNWYFAAFADASKTLSIKLGGINTVVLITSSFTMAMGVWCAETRRRMGLVLALLATLLLGLTFLGIKYVEYSEKFEVHHVPGANFSIETFVNPTAEEMKNYKIVRLPVDIAAKTEIYYSLYFAMTGMHAVHMILGISILIVLLVKAWGGAYTNGHMTTIENFGLYWHFVDIVWIYLFPLLYLISRHA